MAPGTDGVIHVCNPSDLHDYTPTLNLLLDVRRNPQTLNQRAAIHADKHSDKRIPGVWYADRGSFLHGRSWNRLCQPNFISFHGDIRAGRRLSEGRHGNGSLGYHPRHMCNCWVCHLFFQNDLVICERSRTSVLETTKQSKAPPLPRMPKLPLLTTLLLFQVERHTSVPLISIIVTTIIACLLSLINIGSSTAFNDVISLTIDGLYGSYLICCSLLLWRRCAGAISLPNERSPNQHGTLTWGPWHLQGWFGIAVNAFACVYMIIILFFSFWPPVTPTKTSTMNYSALVTGAVLIFSVFYYLLRARKVYTGPVIEVIADQ